MIELETEIAMGIVIIAFLGGATIAMGIVTKFLKPIVDEQQELLEQVIQKYKEDCL